MRKKMKHKKSIPKLWYELRELFRPLVWQLKLCVLVFGVSVLIGVLFPDILRTMLAQITDYLQEIITTTQNPFQLMWKIIINNLRASALAMILGVTIIYPLFFMALNGYVLGAVVRNGIEVAGIGILGKIIPHGIFELPALVIAAALGVYVGSWMSHQPFLQRVRHAAKTYLITVVPLLILAGIIEGILAAIVLGF